MAEKTDPRSAPLTVAIAPGGATRRLALLMEAQPGERTGLSGLVFVEDAAR